MVFCEFYVNFNNYMKWLRFNFEAMTYSNIFKITVIMLFINTVICYLKRLSSKLIIHEVSVG